MTDRDHSGAAPPCAPVSPDTPTRRRLLAGLTVVLAVPTTAPAAFPVGPVLDLAAIGARFEDLWQELFDLPSEVGDARCWAMMVMFDRMSAIVYGRAPMDKSPTLLAALRKVDEPTFSLTGRAAT